MTPQDALRQLVKQDRARSLDDPAWVRAMLSDWCPEPEHRRQVNLLVLACREGVGRDLAGNVGRAIDGFAIARLVSRLVDGHATADEHARWAVGTWALALGVMAAQPANVRASDPVRLPVPVRVPDPAPVADPGRPALVVDAGALWGAYATIGEAIRASVVPGTLITVKPGIYREALVIDRVVEIVGEGDRARIVVEALGTTAITVTADRASVRNLTVRAVGTKENLGAVSVQRGRVVIEGCDLTSAIGSVVYITGKDSAPVIRDCQIRDGKQAGVFVFEQGQGTIERCVISGNANSGVEIRTGGNPTVRNCEIRDGKSAGVFVWEQGQGTIEQCVISGNANSGVAIKTGGNPTVRDCQIRDGQASGVYVWEQGQGTIEKCVISGNANAGVAIRTGGNPVIRDCEIRDGKQAGVMVWDQGQGTIEKCVISGNANAGVSITTGGNPVVRDCEIRDGKRSGVFVHEQGQGTIEQCVISGNTGSGVYIRMGGNPTVRDCKIRDGKQYGVFVHHQGQGTFTGNTLTGNARGAWHIQWLAGRVTRTGNRPNA